MYTSFYKLSGKPFRLSPDHRFYFDGQPHRRAIAYLTYGLSLGEGFVVITGEIGAGKTTLIDHLLARLKTNDVVTGKISTTQIEGDNLLRLAAAAFGIAQEGADKATILKRIEVFLADQSKRNRRALLIVDEVQNLPHSALEELRMLSNFQFGGNVLLQTFLVGQPEFRATLAGPDLEQLRQRVVSSYHLQALDCQETRAYIEHRMGQVGWSDSPTFTAETFERVYEATGGIPRRINLLCDRLLLFGFLEQRTDLDGGAVDAVVADMRAEGLQGLAPAVAAPRVDPAPVVEPTRSESAPPEPAPPAPAPSEPAPAQPMPESLTEDEPLVGTVSDSPDQALCAQIDELSRRLGAFEQRLHEQQARVRDALAECEAGLAVVDS